MRGKLADNLVQLLIAVVASVVATLIVSAVSHLSGLALVALALALICAAEAAIIVFQRRAVRSHEAGDVGIKEHHRPAPYGETLWSGGWKTIDYAIGDVEYLDVVWRPKVPERQGHYAKRVAVEDPARCPVCGTGLLEDRSSGLREYVWRCPTGDFEKKLDESMRDASIGAELIAQRRWEEFKQRGAEVQ